MPMLVAPDKDAPLQQGDIIKDVPFLVLPKAFNVKAEGASGQTRLDSHQLESFEKARTFSAGKRLTATEIPLVLQVGMVVTQSCDLDYKDQITLARVFRIDQMIQSARDAIEHNEPFVLYEVVYRLAEGAEHNHLVYVGNPDGEGQQVADLLRVQSFVQDWKQCFRQQRLKSLSDEGLKYLQGRLATFTGRFATSIGFWQTPEQKQIAEQIAKEPDAIREAHERLAEKKKSKAK
ncbi:MAG TPA: hypothetical protein VJM82_04410 [Nitrospiraceae bacterium]|nr:hypothetical protein [Nitrospiraceae bacterium]